MIASANSTPPFVQQLVAALGSMMNRLFRQPRSNTIIVGTNARTRLFAAELESAGKAVSLIEVENDSAGDMRDVTLLARAGAESAKCLVAATSSDEVNLSLCRTARDSFHVPTVITRMKLLEGVTNWAKLNDSGMVRMAWADVVVATLDGAAPSANLLRLAKATDYDCVAEVELLTPVFAGRTIQQLPLDRCEVFGLWRENALLVPFDLEQLHVGDVLTFIGKKRAVEKLRESFTSL